MEPDTVVAVTAGKWMARGTVPAPAPATESAGGHGWHHTPPAADPDDPRSGTTP